MGLFGKLFEKKECDICGGEIGLLGNRKLEDGNMCKNCARKLSPWFSERRHSTVDEINAQLEYRARNREALETFQPTYEIGKNYRMIAEAVNGVPTRFVVTDQRDYIEENADLIAFADVTDCRVDVSHSSTELEYTNDRNERVSYIPPRYQHNYDFYIELDIANNPYFDNIRFQLNRFSVSIVEERHTSLMSIFRDFDPSYDPEYHDYAMMCEEIQQLIYAGKNPQAQPAAAGTCNFCPECGTPVSGGKFCTNCGTRLG